MDFVDLATGLHSIKPNCCSNDELYMYVDRFAESQSVQRNDSYVCSSGIIT